MACAGKLHKIALGDHGTVWKWGRDDQQHRNILSPFEVPTQGIRWRKRHIDCARSQAFSCHHLNRAVLDIVKGQECTLKALAAKATYIIPYA